MQAVSPLADFSFDYQDLLFMPAFGNTTDSGELMLDPLMRGGLSHANAESFVRRACGTRIFPSRGLANARQTESGSRHRSELRHRTRDHAAALEERLLRLRHRAQG